MVVIMLKKINIEGVLYYMKNFTLNKEEAVLLIIDIQERLTPAMEYGPKVIDNTAVLASVANALGVPIIVTEQYPKGLGKTVEELSDKLEGASFFSKMKFSSCTEEVVDELKKLGRKKVIITGMETHVCVYQTVRDLLSMGYDVFVSSDAVCSRSKQNFKNGLKMISEMGAVVTNTETIFFDFMKEAGTPLFKELSKLIK